jgi:hypothetical protein
MAPGKIDLICPRTLKRLKINFDEVIYGTFVRRSIRQLSNLICLKICVNNGINTSPDGEIWEELIRSSLLSLKRFQFYFTFKLNDNINQIMASFSTPFYLSEKRWFIRCDWSSPTTTACLYSFPFAFKHFEIHTHFFGTGITTLLDNNANKNMYKNVKTLKFNYIGSEPHSAFRPDNINELFLDGTHLPHTWLPILTQLRHLSLGSKVSMPSNSFVCLLENATKLYYLTIFVDTLIELTEAWSNLIVCKLLSNKIRRLHLYSAMSPNFRTLNSIKPRDLQNMVRIFGTNCECLTLHAQSHHLIEDTILPYMKKLRSLHVFGAFHQFSRTFVMNSVEQWQISGKYPNYVNADWNSFHISFDN